MAEESEVSDRRRRSVPYEEPQLTNAKERDEDVPWTWLQPSPFSPSERFPGTPGSCGRILSVRRPDWSPPPAQVRLALTSRLALAAPSHACGHGSDPRVARRGAEFRLRVESVGATLHVPALRRGARQEAVWLIR